MRNGNSKNAPSFMSDDQLKTGSAIDRLAAMMTITVEKMMRNMWLKVHHWMHVWI